MYLKQRFDDLHVPFILSHLQLNPPDLSIQSVSLSRDPWILHCEEHVDILEEVQRRGTALASKGVEKEVKA